MQTATPTRRHLSRAEIEGYWGQALSFQGLLEADGHLHGCRECQVLLRDVVPVPSIPAEARAVPEALHLAYEAMASYVDGSLSDASEQAVAGHVQICRSCRDEVVALQSFARRLEQGLAGTGVLPVAEEEAAGRFEHWMQRVWAEVGLLLAAPQRLRLAGAGLAMVVVGVLLSLQVRVEGGGANDAPRLAQTLHVASSAHGVFGGSLLAVLGAAVLLYGLLKRR